MGLLTNPNPRAGSGLGALLRRRAGAAAWLCYALGAAFLVLMAHQQYSHQTYFSENALLPGLVRGEFDEERAAARYLEDLAEERKRYESGMPVPWLHAMFHQIGLEVHTHNFTLRSPVDRRRTFTGQNVYAILRAPRASSTEALVFSVPYRPPDSPEEPTDVGVAVLMASARFFRKQYYWAKDLIFLVTEHEQLGMQAWLEAYHQRSCGSGVLDYGDLEARGGSIQAAINLELGDATKTTHLNVKVEGLNGQLPNLDLVNLINRLCYREGIPQLFQGRENPPRPESWKGFTRHVSTMLGMAARQATGVPSGNHGLFHRFGIEAVTVEGVSKAGKKGRRQVADLYVLCRVMEGVFRSLNNLLERFHQSFFFYLLPASDRYVSIGMYMPGFGFLGGALVVAALGLWADCVHFERSRMAEVEREERRKQKRKKVEEKDKAAEQEDAGGGEEEDTSLPVVVPSGVTSLLPLLVLAHSLGVTALYLPEVLSRVSEKEGSLDAEDVIALGMAAFSVVTLLLPIRAGARSSIGGRWRILKCLAMLELAVLAFCMSLCNFSLAAIVSAAYVPFALLAAPSSKMSRMGAVVLGLLVHPLSLLAAATCYGGWAGHGWSISYLAEATKHALVFSVADAHIYGSNTYAAATVFLLPCWYLLWCLNFTENSREKELLEEAPKKTGKAKVD